MENDAYSRQGNYLSGGEINVRIIQGNNFTGTVVESLNAPSFGPEAPNIWRSNWRDAVDGSNVPQRGHDPVPRPRIAAYDTSGVISPMQRSQEQVNQPAGPRVFITVRRRSTPLDNVGGTIGLSDEQKEIFLTERRAALVHEYNNITDPTLQRLLSLCAPLLNMDVDIGRKYVELDIWRVFEANQEKSRFIHLTQGLGILEKYASNLIKDSRPPYWRTVKFTSSLVQVHVGRLIGSRDILSQMGYTQDIADGVAFPPNVTEPDVNRLRNLAPDLFFARYEIDALLVNNHPFYEMVPPVPQDEVQLPVLLRVNFPPSKPQRFPERVSNPSSRAAQPVVVTTGAGNTLASPEDEQPSRPPSSPTPAARRKGGREPISLPEGQGSRTTAHSTQEPQAAAENESEEDSEYEDAEEGILPSNDSTQALTDFECRICGESIATKFCKDCKDTFCEPCDGLYHKHASRQRHVRTNLLPPSASPSTVKPVLGAVAAATNASATEQQSRRVASPIATAASVGEESRPRPVPAPRRNKTPLPSYQGMAQGAKTPEPQKEEPPPLLPPRPPHNTPQRQQATPVAAGTQVVASQPMISTSSQAQSQSRGILRPPPLNQAFKTGTQNSTLGADDGRDNHVIVKSPAPPALPPRPPSAARTKLPVESKVASQGPITPEKGTALSCPSCFCLNSGDAKICLFCKKPLPTKTNQGSSSQSVPTRQTEFVETRNFPPPLWALSTEQRGAGRQMQQSPGNVNIGTTSTGAGQSTVDSGKWECEYCTYHNPRTRRICEMCCKTSRNDPVKSTEFPTTNPVSQQATPRETQRVTNMAMQMNSQQIQTAPEPTKKADPQNLQAAPTGIPTRPAAEPALGNAFPVQGNQQTRMWEGSARPTQANPPGPPLANAFPGMGSAGQSGLPNPSGVVNPDLPARGPFPSVIGYSPGGMVFPGVNQFIRDAGLPFGPQGFPPPPPMTWPPFGSMSPELLPEAGPFHSHTGNAFLQQHVGPGFPPPWTAGPDEAVRREQEEIYIAGSRYVEWLRKAEKEGFTAEELNIASVLGIDDPQGPIHWLQTAWYDLIHRVMGELAVPENSQEIGNVSPEEVREAVIECTGEVTQATAKCMDIRKKKVRELQQTGVYAKTDCISALDSSEGDTEKAILALEKMAMRPMLQRVLNSCLPDHATESEVFMALTRQINTESQQEKTNFEAIVTDKRQDQDRRIRAVLAEKNVSSWGRAETAVKLIDMNYSVEDSIEAACNCGDLQRSLRYLQQECPLCMDEKPMSQMVTFLHCQDRVCQECVSQYITITIKDKNILHLVCPVCSKPENLDDEVVATEYFNNFDIMIRGLVDQDTHDLFQRKLRDRTLMKEPNFRWCSHCSSGFINEQPGQLRMACPHCQQYTCFKCKRQWEDQHQGITCEQFAAWKEANDPEFQAAGLAAHLRMNGIVCPGCKFRYDLSKGGCMHFKCAMCPHEFCSGCYNPFRNTNAQNCLVSEHCTVGGLHAHHPRDCYFYLRDRSPAELQKLLRDNGVAYNTEPPQGQGNASDDEAPAGAAAAPLRCKVNEQKETENSLMDAECGADVPAGHAGLCGKHYVEYLVVLVNDNLLDPADIMSSNDLRRVLERGFVEPPPQNRMNEEQYKQLLLQTVKEQLPLPPKSPRKRILDDEDDVQVVQNVEIDDDSDDDDDDDDNIIVHGLGGPLLEDSL